ncbi:hypothetical protein I4F81_002593 [Pyropia yezoensis]|uniref:Uncharacterized protein n=1 Tax=Pyropia yezoensis TaxID=2788 RepID=A0ACC3BRG5_PYRYE|nr:hypothetical protein I4F81_002593 [Neopyropia yezoensis]
MPGYFTKTVCQSHVLSPPSPLPVRCSDAVVAVTAAAPTTHHWTPAPNHDVTPVVAVPCRRAPRHHLPAGVGAHSRRRYHRRHLRCSRLSRPVAWTASSCRTGRRRRGVWRSPSSSGCWRRWRAARPSRVASRWWLATRPPTPPPPVARGRVRASASRGVLWSLWYGENTASPALLTKWVAETGATHPDLV